jgi:O-Antigen ligase
MASAQLTHHERSTAAAWTVAIVVAVAAAFAATSWPTAAILAGLLVVVLALCVHAPAYAFAASLALYAFEGTFKMGLGVNGDPSPAATGAVALDCAFLCSLVALVVVHDRGQSLAHVWRGASVAERVSALLLAGWLALSLVQVPVSGDLVNGLEGLRLTQGYVPAALGGLVLAARLGSHRLPDVLLWVILPAVAYAALRGLTGPTDAEQAYAEARAPNASFDELGRNVGSFTGPVGLVSFLVPAALVGLALALLRARPRVVALALFALAMTGIVGSYVRTALAAVVVGAGLLTALLLGTTSGRARRRGAFGVVVVAVVLFGGYAAALYAGSANPATKWRAESLAHPFTDYSVTNRLDLWGHTLDLVADEPFGSGLGTVGRATVVGRQATFTDNSYLKVLREQGIPGALLFLGGLGGIVIAVTLRLIRANPLRRPVGTAALVGFAGFLALSVMGEYIEQPGKLLAWTLLGVAIWETLGRAEADGETAV